VIANPFAPLQEDLSELITIARTGGLLARCLAHWHRAGPAESYGKAAVVGENANWNTRGDPPSEARAPLRKAVSKGAAWFVGKNGRMARLSTSPGHKDAASSAAFRCHE